MHESFTLHWDGARWFVVDFPDLGRNTQLYGVSGVASDDVWAVGSNDIARYTPATLTAHWDGVRWSVIPSPDVDGAVAGLYGVDARASDDVWAVGWYSFGEQGGSIALHWDGTRWHLFRGPAHAEYAVLRRVVLDKPDHAWAVGSKEVDEPFREYIVEGAGFTWEEVRTRPPDGYSSLHDVDSAGGVTWAVGVDYLEVPGDYTSDVLIDRVCT